MEREELPDRAMRAGGILTRALGDLPAVTEVRGSGCLLAAELDGRPAADVVAAALDRGLLVNAPTPTAVRLMPPLNVSDEHIEEAVGILGEVLG